MKPRVSAAPRLDGSSALISWEPISDDDAHGYLTQIEIAYRPARGRDDDCSDFDPNANEVDVLVIDEQLDSAQSTLDGLTADMEYCVAVRASTASGPSPFSAPTKVSCKSSLCTYVSTYACLREYMHAIAVVHVLTSHAQHMHSVRLYTLASSSDSW